MMTHAYDESYLHYSMRNVGVMIHYGINVFGLKPDEFFDRFIKSGVADFISSGNPRYLCGLSGPELAVSVMDPAPDDHQYDDITGYYTITPEYWSGWALTYYQWYKNCSFREIQQKGISLERVISMYNPLHEADLSKFVEVMDSCMSEMI